MLKKCKEVLKKVTNKSLINQINPPKKTKQKKRQTKIPKHTHQKSSKLKPKKTTTNQVLSYEHSLFKFSSVPPRFSDVLVLFSVQPDS